LKKEKEGQKMTKKLSFLLILLVLVFFFVTACGGGGGKKRSKRCGDFKETGGNPEIASLEINEDSQRLEGEVVNVNPNDYKVVVLLEKDGVWRIETKNGAIECNETFSVNIYNENADQTAVFIVNNNYELDIKDGFMDVPEDLYDNALVFIILPAYGTTGGSIEGKIYDIDTKNYGIYICLFMKEEGGTLEWWTKSLMTTPIPIANDGYWITPGFTSDEMLTEKIRIFIVPIDFYHHPLLGYEEIPTEIEDAAIASSQINLL